MLAREKRKATADKEQRYQQLETVKESQSLKGIAKMKFDKKHKESLTKYPEMRERLQNLWEQGEKTAVFRLEFPCLEISSQI